MCLAAAQRTVAADFLVHSCHCYFLLAGSSEMPILFHVEQVRDGRSFATRTVQARQRGRCIFTTTISFSRESSGAEDAASGGIVTHSSLLPLGSDGRPLQPPPPEYKDESGILQGPLQGAKIDLVDHGGRGDPGQMESRQWVRARGPITGGTTAQLEALAYMSDSYFIGTITRLHKLWRFPFPAEDYDKLPAELQAKVKALHQWEGMGEDPREMVGRPSIGMMVSLDHTLYFHAPKKVRADDWMLTEMSSPWAGDNRGVVMQKIYSKDGTLLATCVQEVCSLFLSPRPGWRKSCCFLLTRIVQGLVRLQPPAKTEGKESKM
jgi:acyl-CoA thioesterase